MPYQQEGIVNRRNPPPLLAEEEARRMLMGTDEIDYDSPLYMLGDQSIAQSGALNDPAQSRRRAVNMEAMRRLSDPTPSELDYSQEMGDVGERQKGWKARLAGMGKGFLLDGFRGMIRGGVDPTTINIAWNQPRLQHMGQTAGVDRGIVDSTTRRMRDVSSMTGIDPITGEETPEAAYRRITANANLQRANTGQQRADIYRNRVDFMNNNDQKKAAVAELNSRLSAFKAGGVLSPDTIMNIEMEYGVKLPTQFDPGKYRLEVDRNGQLMIIPMAGPSAGEAAPVTAPAGEPVTSSKDLPSDKMERTEKMAAATAANAEKREAGIQSRHSENLQIRKRQLTAEEERKISKQAQDEINAEEGPQFAPTDQEKAERARKIEERKKKLRANLESTGAANAGETVIKRQRNTRTGQVRELVRRSDGTTFWRDR